MLPEAIGWIVHPLAGLGLALWASVLYGPRGQRPQAVLVVALVLAALSAIGAGWVVHPAGGMLLGYLGARAFRPGWRREGGALAAAALAGVVFAVSGAAWLSIALGIMAVIWLSTRMFAQLDGDEEREALSPGQAPAALPEQAGGWPFGGDRQREAVPVARAGMSAVTAARSAELDLDPFTALQLDARLPGEIRAQLIALDLRSKEALTHLERQGLQGSEAAYSLRAIRDEYAPDSVRAYLSLPRTRADVTPLEDDKTGRDLLREQLELLLSAVQEILDGAARTGGRDLLTQQRFLRERFGKKGGGLDV